MNRITRPLQVASYGALCALMIGCDVAKAQDDAEVEAAVKAETEAAAREAAMAAERAKAIANAEAAAKKAAEEAEAAAKDAVANAAAAVAEAEAAAKPVDEARRPKIIQTVMSYLESEELSIYQSQEDAKGKDTANHAYANFSYNERDKTLEYQEMRLSSSDTKPDGRAGNEASYLFDFKVKLPTASSVISISDYKPASSRAAGLGPPAKQVTIKAKYSTRSIEKKEDTGDKVQRRNSAMLTDADVEKLTAKPWKEQEGEISFVVSEDVAPRLKAALEGLLKAHGIQAPKN